MENFEKLEFEFPGIVKSLVISLAIPSTNRVANVTLYDHTIDELQAYPHGQMPSPVGKLQFTLWQATEVLKY